VTEPWLEQIEALEAISQNEDARRLFLHMAQMSQVGKLEPMLSQLEHSQDFDDDTREGLIELARDRSFLLALDDYVHRTRVYQ
jgi:hypothetical protein